MRPNICICSDSITVGPFFIFVDGCVRGQGMGPDGSAGGASLAPINKTREHDGPLLCPYIDHKWPESLQPSMFGRIDYIGYAITIPSDLEHYLLQTTMESLQPVMIG